MVMLAIIYSRLPFLLISANEIRNLEDINRYEGKDEYFVQMNMQPIKSALDGKKTITPEEIEIRCQISDIRNERRSDDSKGRTLSGYAAKFDRGSQPIMGWFREKIHQGTFDEDDMSDAIMCFNYHIAYISCPNFEPNLNANRRDRVTIYFGCSSTARVNDVVEWIRREDVNKCSFRFVVEKEEWLYADDRNSNEYDEGSILKISKPYDCALVVYSAYKNTEA